MEQSNITSTAEHNYQQRGSGEEYDSILETMRKRVDALGGVPFFTTDVAGLFEAYVASFPETERQWHTCHCCRRFIETYGGLVTIEDDGRTESVFWAAEDVEPASPYWLAIMNLRKLVRRAKVTGVFLSRATLWGTPETPDKKRGFTWTHFYWLPIGRVFIHKLLEPNQVMAAKHEEFGIVQRALAEYSAETMTQALTLLKSDVLYRSEKVLGPVQWLAELKVAVEAAHGFRSNLVWKAVALAPAGFCHPRSSMGGTLLDDLQNGKSFEDASRSFKAKMHPLQYQRPQAAPTAGAIAAAEKLVEKLGIAPALPRRFARLEEIQTVWKPAQPAEQASSGGVFGHLTPKGAEPNAQLNVPEQVITWVKFRDTVLPTAKSMALLVPHSGNFSAMLTAQNADAPPIHQWDSEERRNPFSQYVYRGGSDAPPWGLEPNAWVKVTAISLHPAQWQAGFDHHAKSAIFMLQGAADSRHGQGNALFPESLKSELHGVRSVIEAYSKAAEIGGREEASACGLATTDGENMIHVRVTDANGIQLKYRIDRWD